MSKANAEQQLAIFHEGGVLLKAGAGSGKTFVLVQHIIHLTRSVMEKSRQNSSSTFEELIRQKFSGIVMMTFTKKAAGEMSIRLVEEFNRLAEEIGPEKELWVLALDALPCLMVTTIDGFCKKLISAGYFPHLSTEAEVIFNEERIEQVRGLFEDWFAERSHSLAGELHDIVVREKYKLLVNFTKVFGDPGLRLKWKKYSVEDASPSKFGKLLLESFYLNDIDKALLSIGNLELRAEKDRSAFEKTIALLQATGLPEVDSVEKLVLYEQIFSNLSRLSPESAKTKTPLHEEAMEGAKALRAWVNGDSKKTGWQEIIPPYVDHFQTKVVPWIKVCQEIFSYIDQGLDPNQGMTFGDIEYHVALGLEIASLRKRIQDVYSYFIVDEFQDTSALQFKIVSDLLGGDFKKLFCVGDPKQAIYGFRGGELSVFQNCALLVPVTRTLANNYRSLPQVINFNNSLFKSILPSGMGFSGSDPMTVEAEDQMVPPEVIHAHSGAVEILRRTLHQLSLDEESEEDSDEDDVSTGSLDFEEAQVIAESIEQERLAHPDRTCTILYRKLQPAKALIRELIRRNIGFTAQYKIKLVDDPIVGMFLILLKRQFDTNVATRNAWPLFMFKSYMGILRIPSAPTEADLESFDQNVKFWGLPEAFRKFMTSLRMTNENSDLNLGVITTLCELYYQDQEAILQQISGGDSTEIRLDFRFGKDAHRVQMMTAHSSKGLEFDTVYLAGIYSNGKDKPEADLFGKTPESFYWHFDLASKDKRKSPFYHHESLLNTHKVFSEAKRLFYVAATRAKQKLVWVDFTNVDELIKINKNSWVQGLRLWMESTRDADVLKALTISTKEQSNETSTPKKSPDLPLYFHDTVGIIPREGLEADLAIMAELSVTRLNSLIDCPRKFYLENVLKLAPTGQRSFEREKFEDHDEIKVLSSSERGTLIHAQIEKGIAHNFIVPREIFNTEHHAPVAWALDQLKPLSADFELLAEKSLKFKFFNFMISGIPDLYLLPKSADKKAQIWDFKTGRITPTALSHYWIQLKVYAYALYHLGFISRESEVDLKLCFVDQKKFLDLSISFDTIQPELFELWKSQNEPWRVKTEHCAQCSYGDICPR